MHNTLKEQFNQKFPLRDELPSMVSIGAYSGKEWIKQNILQDLLNEFELILKEYVPTQFDGEPNPDYERLITKIDSLRKF
jgi:hypothetical protein